MRTEILPEGKLVFGEGDPGHEAFLIKKGSIEVSIEDRDQKVVLANLGVGEIFGEMAMIENRPRSASARALTETEVEIIDRDEFLEALKDDAHKRTSLEGVVIRHYPFLLGRRGEVVGTDGFIQNQLLLADPPPYRVSRKHCLLDISADGIFVEDHTSKLGTIVNGTRIGGSSCETRARLSAGENILVLGGPDSQARFKLWVEAV